MTLEYGTAAQSVRHGVWLCRFIVSSWCRRWRIMAGFF
jgi:hypothetical protein